MPGVFENYQVAALLVCTVALVWRYHTLNQRQHTFSEYGHIANRFGFVGHVVSITITQLCHCSVKAGIDNTQMSEHV